MHGHRAWPRPPSPREGKQQSPPRFFRRACRVRRGNRIQGASSPPPPRGREPRPARSPPRRGTLVPPPLRPECRGDDGGRRVSFVSGHPREGWKRERCRVLVECPHPRTQQRRTRIESARSRPPRFPHPEDSIHDGESPCPP